MTFYTAQVRNTTFARMLHSPCSSTVSAGLSRSQPLLGFSRGLQPNAGALGRCMGAGVLSRAARKIAHPIKAAAGPMGAATGTSKPPPGPWELLNPSEYTVEPGSMQDKVWTAVTCQIIIMQAEGMHAASTILMRSQVLVQARM